MRSLSIIILTILLISCSSQSVKNVINKPDKISSLKKTGIIFRIPLNASIAKAEYEKNLTYWFAGYKKSNLLHIINSAKDEISYYNESSDRFYQLSDSKTFLTYKSMGSILLFCEKNRSNLETLMADNDLDSILIYEIDSDFSMELQFYDYELLVTILDRKLDIIYMDHSTKTFNIDELDPEKGKTSLIDNVIKRFLNTMIDLDLIEKK